MSGQPVTGRSADELVRVYWDVVWGERKIDLVDELMTDPYTRHAASGTQVLSREQLKRDLVELWKSLYDARTVIDDLAIVGDRIWLRATTKAADLLIGQQSVRTWMIQHRVEDGRLAESWSAVIPGIDWVLTPTADAALVAPRHVVTSTAHEGATMGAHPLRVAGFSGALGDKSQVEQPVWLPRPEKVQVSDTVKMMWR
jgi:hypothetical protein